MGVMPVNKLLVTMSLPIVISMLIQAMYNLVDSVFVAQINPDAGHPTKDTVTIEMRDPAFTLQAMGVRTAAEGVKGYYPAFDLTPPHLISGIVTDRGVFSPFDLQRYFSSGGMGEYEMVV